MARNALGHKDSVATQASHKIIHATNMIIVEVRENDCVQVDNALLRKRLRDRGVGPRVHEHGRAAVRHKDGIPLPHIQHAYPCGLQQTQAKQGESQCACQRRNATHKVAATGNRPEPVESDAGGNEGHKHGGSVCLHGQAR